LLVFDAMHGLHDGVTLCLATRCTAAVSRHPAKAGVRDARADCEQ
jgi:hypothetical protein